MCMIQSDYRRLRCHIAMLAYLFVDGLTNVSVVEAFQRTLLSTLAACSV